MKIPYIASSWKTLFTPRRFGRYVNDHTLYYDGKWHLIGITSKKGIPTEERYFVHAVGDSLRGKMKEYCKVIDNGTLAWAPCVIEKDGLYYMFYGPSPTKLAVSFDSGDWFGQEIFIKNLPPMACHRDHFVLKFGGEYIMYAVGTRDRKSSVCALTSQDLINWEFKGYALTSGENAPLNPSWGAFESPYVVEKDGLFYLFITYTDCSKNTYHDTLVFASETPYSFGEYNGGKGGAVPLTKLFCHAPEIIAEGGRQYITTCGWRKSSFTKGKVKIAELRWK